MVRILAGSTVAIVGLLVFASLIVRLRAVYQRDSLWNWLWARGPWYAAPVAADGHAPTPLRALLGTIASGQASVQTVAQARFVISNASSSGKPGIAGQHLAVLAFPHGAVLRWRSTHGVRTGHISCTDGRAFRREWAFGVIPIPRRAADGSDRYDVRLLHMAYALSFCWTPVALLQDSSVKWSEQPDGSLAGEFMDAQGPSRIRVTLSADGLPGDVSTFSAKSGERPVLKCVLSDFAVFEGYRLPRHVALSDPDDADFHVTATLGTLEFARPWTDLHRT